MEKHWDLFKGPEARTRGVFHNCPSGGQCSEINPVKLEAYDLYKTYRVVDSDSYGALEKTLNTALVKREPVFAYYWAPTSLISQEQWYILEEPAHTPCCWNEVHAASKNPALRPLDQGCAYPNPGIQILASSRLRERDPKVATLLSQMRMGIEPLEETAE